MTLAHVGAVPIEELLATLAVTGSGVAAALRAGLLRSARRR
jgi:hypothetical protein